MKIAILQPEIPHYRKEFFNLLQQKVDVMDLYVYNTFEHTKKNGFNQDIKSLHFIPNFQIKGVLFYSPFQLLTKKYDILILPLHQAHFTSWLLLSTQWLHRKKIVVWGQGISIKRYIKEEKKPNILLKWMIRMAKGIWIYMPKELALWKNIFPRKKMTALYNTVGGAMEMINYKPILSKEELKQKYNINEKIIFIYCARFNTSLRRNDLLENTIQQLDSQKFGFIIIGDGAVKPNFNVYNNVHDFGSFYDDTLKRELFSIADAYFQPAWMGLSIVESMAYGKPVFTFKRTEETKQGVEYNYIINNETGLLFDNITDCINRLTNINLDDIQRMGTNAKELIKNYATPDNMTKNAISLLEQI